MLKRVLGWCTGPDTEGEQVSLAGEGFALVVDATLCNLGNQTTETLDEVGIFSQFNSSAFKGWHYGAKFQTQSG